MCAYCSYSFIVLVDRSWLFFSYFMINIIQTDLPMAIIHISSIKWNTLTNRYFVFRIDLFAKLKFSYFRFLKVSSQMSISLKYSELVVSEKTCTIAKNCSNVFEIQVFKIMQKCMR